MLSENSIEVSNLTKKFGSFTAVDNISFSITRGEIFGFLGANGAGKSTAMKMLCGLLYPTSGHANVAGFDVVKETEMVKRKIGYMSQKFSLYQDLTARENIRFYAGIYGMSDNDIKTNTKQLLEKLKLSRFADVQIKSFPLGWKQKLAFSVAVFHRPEIVFLDEPTGGIDPVTRREFWEMIYATADQGTTIFVTTHYMDESEYCDRISIMVDGRIEALGTPNELKRDFQVASMDEVFVKLARPTTAKAE